MSTLEPVVRELLAATEDLAAAVESDRDEKLDQALERRNRAFEAVVLRLTDDPPEGVRDLLRQVRQLDESILSAASTARDEIRAELETLAHAQSVTRRLQPERGKPRFVARRA